MAQPSPSPMKSRASEIVLSALREQSPEGRMSSRRDGEAVSAAQARFDAVEQIEEIIANLPENLTRTEVVEMLQGVIETVQSDRGILLPDWSV